MTQNVKFTQVAVVAVARFIAEGPFTFAQLLAVAKKCARTDNVRLDIDEVLFRFSDEELTKFLHAGREDKGVCTLRNYKKLRIGLDLGEIFYLDLTRFTQGQLALLEREMSYVQFEYLLESIQLSKLTSQERMNLLSLVQTSQRQGIE
jgi:hypothetical protein